MQPIEELVEIGWLETLQLVNGDGLALERTGLQVGQVEELVQLVDLNVEVGILNLGLLKTDGGDGLWLVWANGFVRSKHWGGIGGG